MYQGKQRHMASTDFTPSHGMAQELIRKVAGVGHNYFTSLEFFTDIHLRKMNACGTVCHKRKEMPTSFSPKILLLKRGNTVSRVWYNLTAVCC
jgi:hypothetical protein